MTKFEKGDNIIIYKPTNTEQYPRWDYAMSQFNGRVLTFLRYDSEGNILIEEDITWSFHPDWCEKVDQLPDAGKMVGTPQLLSTEIDWEQRKWEASVAAIQGILASGLVSVEEDEEARIAVSDCIRIANEMIKQLKQQ